jgi:hypothetical protein
VARGIFILLYIAAAAAVWLALPIRRAAALLAVNAAAVFGFNYLFDWGCTSKGRVPMIASKPTRADLWNRIVRKALQVKPAKRTREEHEQRVPVLWPDFGPGP